MEAIIAILVGAASVAWWKRLRKKPPAVEDFLDAEAQVVIHVAEHEQRTRSQPTLTAMHILYGLLQDETIAGALTTVGAEVATLEDRVLAALDTAADHQRAVTADAHAMLTNAVNSAYHNERKTSVTDLWAYLLRTEALALLEASKVDSLAVLHLLVHATQLPALTDGPGDVHVVLRNDDYTSQEFVTQLLIRVFELPEEDAVAKMLATHTDGKVVLARLPVSVAHARIRKARELARAAHFPLWIAAEPT